MENGEDEEDDMLDDSMADEAQTIQLRIPTDGQKPGSRAPTMTIEAVRVGRPLKVISLLLNLFGILMFVLGTASTYWIQLEEKRIGLFHDCLLDKSQMQSNQLNSRGEVPYKCVIRTDIQPELLASTILNLSAILMSVIGVGLLISGMMSLMVKRKGLYYNLSITFNVLAGVAMILSIALLTITFSQKINTAESDKAHVMSVGWSLIVSSCGVGTLLLAVVFLACDRSADEIDYREIIHRTPIMGDGV